MPRYDGCQGPATCSTSYRAPVHPAAACFASAPLEEVGAKRIFRAARGNNDTNIASATLTSMLRASNSAPIRVQSSQYHHASDVVGCLFLLVL